MLKNIPIWSHCLQRTRPFRQTIFYRIVLIRSLKNGPTPAPFLIYFWSFSNKQYNFKTNQCEKISCPSSIQRSDSNPQPFKHESSPKTTSLCPVFSLSKQNKKICHIFTSRTRFDFEQHSKYTWGQFLFWGEAGSGTSSK